MLLHDTQLNYLKPWWNIFTVVSWVTITILMLQHYHLSMDLCNSYREGGWSIRAGFKAQAQSGSLLAMGKWWAPYTNAHAVVECFSDQHEINEVQLNEHSRGILCTLRQVLFHNLETAPLVMLLFSIFLGDFWVKLFYTYLLLVAMAFMHVRSC